MSTTTNFKRIALVAVAALGLGVLSSVPSQAASMADDLTVSQTAASQTTTETVTASVTTVTLAFTATDTTTDALKLTASLASGPAGGGLPYLSLVETSNAGVRANNASTANLEANAVINPGSAVWESATAVAANSVVSAKFKLYIGSTATAAPTKAGTYVVTLTPAIGQGGGTLASTAKTVTITVATAATQDVKAAASTTTSYIYYGSSDAASLTTADSVVAFSKVAKATPAQAATIYVTQLNAAGTASTESLTATISGPGTIGSGGTSSQASQGRSLTVKKGDYITVWPDGTAGTATITISGAVTGTVLATETVKFVGDLASFTGSAKKAILAVGTGVNLYAVGFTASDGSNVFNDEPTDANNVQATWYAFSSDTAIATVASLTYSSDSGTVSVNGVKAGSTTIVIGNASTLAASTIKSAPIAVRVGSTSIASVKVAFDKTTYAPGEAATVTLSAYDATNQLVVPGKYEFWAPGYELATDKSFNQGTITVETATTTSSTTGVKTYTVYMPLSAGKVTLTGVLAAASGTYVGSGATLALALATTVASLKTLIVTLTNLVLKIQKKVKA
jgi:hypothetical protein